MSKSKKEQTVLEVEQPQKVLNPFPGLRPFSIDESHLFFGREGQSEEVLKQLSRNRFVAIIGASGSGKSSLIYCGLIPILYGGFIAEAGSEWKLITTRPGTHPVENLAESLAEADERLIEEERPVARNITLAILRRSSLGLTEAISRIGIAKDTNILLMVDQFEELFRFKRSRRDESSFNESEAYVKLLVEAINQTKLPIYMVLTMRSDFIGECSQFQDLTRLINRSNYLIPQMTRDDFRDAVTGPVAVGQATIDPNLVQQLLNDVGDNPDQLPILQHAMMRTWDYWLQQKDTERQISLSDYNAVGRMEKALSEHANEAYEELSDREKEICENMFKTLTDKGGDNIGIRRPTRVEVIADIARADVDEIIKVVEVFRAPGRSFLAPAHHIELTAESVIDISHESLMRIWDRLKIWVDEEATAVQMYKRLSEAAELFQRGKTGLWRPPDLQLALNWKKKQQPTLTWAEQYNPAFERTMVFLDTSEKEFIAEEENKIRLQKRQLRRSRVFASVLGTAAIISIGLMLWSFVLRGQAIAATEEATRQKSLADSSATIAREQEQLATASAIKAQRQQELADSAADVAKTQSERAVASAIEANIQQKKAEESAIEAKKQQALADSSAEVASKQRKLAVEASAEATRRQMLSTAQSMAVKSLQVDNDTNLKALLAFQAYLFNLDNGGVEHHADIYAALHSAMLVQKGKNSNVFTGHIDAVRSLVFLPGTNTFFSAGSDGQIRKWDINDPEKKSTIIIDNELVNRIIDVSNDGKWLACGTDGMGIQLFDISKSTDGQPVTFSGHTNRIRALDFMPDNQHFLSAGADNQILHWDLKTGTSKVFSTTDALLQVIVISDDGKWVAGGTESGQILLWESARPENKIVLYQENRNEVLSLRFNPSGTLLASGDRNGNVKIWNIERKNMVINLRGHSARITGLSFSRDGKLLASTSYDASARLWDAGDWNNQPVVLEDNSGYVFSVTFSPDSKFVLTGSADENRLVINPTSTKIMAADICDKIERNFTQEEWNTYVGEGITYVETCTGESSIGVKK
jgi:energy-coupling factor transporter ATP-binding protein EcfA2/cytoskeletal protein RodZ